MKIKNKKRIPDAVISRGNKNKNEENFFNTNYALKFKCVLSKRNEFV
jgi:hypothetical protein